MAGNPLDDLTQRIDAHEQCCRELMAALNALVEFLPKLTLPSSKDMAHRDDAVKRIKAALYRAGRMYG